MRVCLSLGASVSRHLLVLRLPTQSPWFYGAPSGCGWLMCALVLTSCLCGAWRSTVPCACLRYHADFHRAGRAPACEAVGFLLPAPVFE